MMFECKDKDGTGTLNSKELESCLQLCGLIPTKDDIAFLTKHFDSNGDGRLQIEELVENIDVLNEHSVNGERLKEAFLTFDVNNDGYIRMAEIIQILTHNDFMTAEDARKLATQLSNKYDTDRDGKFNYIEFVSMISKEDLLAKRAAIQSIQRS